MPIHHFIAPMIAGSSAQGGAGYVPAGAIYLDGSADYLQIDPGAGDSIQKGTWSFWFKLNEISADVRYLIDFTGTANNGWESIAIGTDHKLFCYWNASVVLKTDAVFRDPTAWNHIVLQIDTTEITDTDRANFWINGVKVTDFTTESYMAQNANASFYNSSGTRFTIGSDNTVHGAGQNIGAYFSEFIYLDNYSNVASAASDFGEFDAKGNWVPIDPTDFFTANKGTNGFWLKFADSADLGKNAALSNPLPGETVLLIHSNTTDGSTTFVDSAKGATISVSGSMQHDDAQAKFGTTAIYGASTPPSYTDYITVPDSSNLTFGSNDFTIEFWYRNNGAYPSSVGWMDKLQGAPAREWTFGIQGGNIIFQFSNDGSASWHNLFNYAHSLVADTWYHIAVTRNGSNWYLFIDGVLVDTDTDSASIYNSSAVVRINSDDIGGFDGWIDEIVIVNGKCRYTASFDVPTEAYDGINWTLTSITPANSTNDRPADDATADPVEGNYCTWNPLAMNSSPTVSEGNLKIAGNSATNYRAVPTIIPSSGKWHYEWQWQGPTIAAGMFIGVEASRTTNYIASVSQPGATSTSWGASTENSTTLRVYHNSSYNDRTIPFTFVQNDYIVCDFDVDAGDIWLGVHDVSGGTTYWVNGSGTFTSTFPSGSPTYSGVTMADGVLFPAVGTYTSTYYGKANFGQNTFVSNQPTGFKALATANLPAPTVTDPSAYFKAVLYTGNSSTQAITGVGFQPDLVWLKCRDTAFNHQLMDAVQGASSVLAPNLTDAASTSETDSFDSDGFTLTHNPAIGRANVNTKTFVAWCLKAGGAGSANTDGSITSTVSVADHGGFSIGTYTGTGANATFGHGLSSDPDFFMIKCIDQAYSWACWHKDLTTGDYLVRLDTNGAEASQAGGAWQNNPIATSGVITLGPQTGQNSVDAHVFYAFARVPGLIGIGSYRGNGSTNGPYVVVDDGGSGFRPAWLMIKRTDSANNWTILDAARSPYNPTDLILLADTTGAESGAGSAYLDLTANGFKIRTTALWSNASGGKYIYLAFAEYPFGGEGVAQAKAR